MRVESGSGVKKINLSVGEEGFAAITAALKQYVAWHRDVAIRSYSKAVEKSCLRAAEFADAVLYDVLEQNQEAQNA